MQGFYRVILATLCLSLAATNAPAALVDGLYSAAVPVTDRSDEMREEGYRVALATVLVRVTGQRGLASDPDLLEALEGAPRLVQQYRYTADGELWVSFDGRAVEQLAADAGLPVWGRNRPATLVWLAVDNGGGDRRLVAADDEDEQVAMLAEAARERGVPLVWPLMDSEDREALSFADVWGNFQDRVMAASERYDAEAVLIGRATRAREGYSVRWLLNVSETSDTWRGNLADGAHRAADVYARHFTVQNHDDVAGSLYMIVEGLESLRSYAAVSRYLERLTLTSRVHVLEVAETTATFRVDVRDDPRKLVRAISFGAMLRPLSESAVGGGTDSISALRYQYGR